VVIASRRSASCLLLAVPLLTYVLYRHSEERRGSAGMGGQELKSMGGLTRREIELGALVCWRWRCGSSRAP